MSFMFSGVYRWPPNQSVNTTTLRGLLTIHRYKVLAMSNQTWSSPSLVELYNAYQCILDHINALRFRSLQSPLSFVSLWRPTTPWGLDGLWVLAKVDTVLGTLVDDGWMLGHYWSAWNQVSMGRTLPLLRLRRLQLLLLCAARPG